MLNLSYLEILLSQNKVIESLNDNNLNKLNIEVEKKYKEKALKPNIFGKTKNVFYSIRKNKSDIDKVGISPMSSIVYTYVYTPMFSKVSVFSDPGSFNLVEKYKIQADILYAFPNVTILADADPTYNCHSYAWYSQSFTGNPYWMNDPSAYMTDGSYTYVGNSSNKLMDRIYYNYPGYEHSGIVTSMDGKITSKWGQACVVKHNFNDCPYYFSQSNTKYYTPN